MLSYFQKLEVEYKWFFAFEEREYFRILHLNQAAIVQDAGVGNQKLKFNFFQR